MKVITKRPIVAEEMSNCCGSNFDAEMSNCCGSNFDGEALAPDMGDDAFSYANDSVGAVKEYAKAQKGARKSFRTEYVTDVLADKTASKESSRGRKVSRREARQLARSERKEARFQRNSNRKAKRNAKKLILIKTQGREKYFFPISRVRLGKKKYKDGTESEIAKENQINVSTSTGEMVTVDKVEVSKALGIDPNQVTPAVVQSQVSVIPQNVAMEQGASAEVVQQSNEPVIALNVPENLVETAGDGELYVTTDLQNTSEKDKDVKDEEKGLTKTQKIVLWSAGVVALAIVGYLIYKAVSNKPKTA